MLLCRFQDHQANAGDLVAILMRSRDTKHKKKPTFKDNADWPYTFAHRLFLFRILLTEVNLCVKCLIKGIKSKQCHLLCLQITIIFNVAIEAFLHVLCK